MSVMGNHCHLSNDVGTHWFASPIGNLQDMRSFGGRTSRFVGTLEKGTKFFFGTQSSNYVA